MNTAEKRKKSNSEAAHRYYSRNKKRILMKKRMKYALLKQIEQQNKIITNENSPTKS